MNPWTLALFGFGGIVISVVIFKRPAIGAALILGLVHFERALIFNGISLVKLLSIVCIGILFARVLIKDKGIRIDRTAWLIALFLAWVAITVFWSSNQSVFLSEFVSLCLQAFMYILIINLIRSKDDLQLALWGHVIGGTVLAVILSITMINLNFVRSTEMEIAGLGINLAARMVGLNLLLAVLLAQLVESRLAKIVLILVAIISGIGSLLALSRGNWVALIVSAGVVIFIMSVKKGSQFNFRQIILVGIIGIATMYAANQYFFSDYGLSKLQDRAESSVTLSDGASGRFDIWRTAYIPFLEKPLFGHGFNTFKQLNEWKHTGAHNAFVLLAIEDGLLGVFLYCLIIGSVFFSLFNLNRIKVVNPVALGWGLALLVFLVIVSLVDSAVNRKYLWFVLGIISLLIYYYGQNQSVDETVEEFEPIKEIETTNQLA